MKSAWAAAFVLSLCCTPLSHPQQVSSSVPPPESSSPTTKAATAQTTPESAQPAAPESVSAVIDSATGSEVTEEELRQALLNRHLFLRGLWLSDDLHFGLTGALASQSARGSFTLCDVQIEKVRLTKKRLELEGARYGIHFDDVADWSQQASAFDRIRITPKKKHLLIVIDRQVVVSPKKEKKQGRGGRSQPAQPQAAPVAAAPAGQTTNGAAAAALLRADLDRIFSPALDSHMIDAMPDYWQYFYNAQTKHQSIEPTDPNILRPGGDVAGPTLVHNIVPPSNDYAQHAQVAGVASYKVILGADGKPIAVAVYRPIGFGLDENAVAAIRKATFAPAHRDGKAVASVIDMAVVFRILSPLTEKPVAPETAALPPNVSPVTGKPSLPGPFTAAAQAAPQ